MQRLAEAGHLDLAMQSLHLFFEPCPLFAQLIEKFGRVSWHLLLELAAQSRVDFLVEDLAVVAEHLRPISGSPKIGAQLLKNALVSLLDSGYILEILQLVLGVLKVPNRTAELQVSSFACVRRSPP